MAVGGRATKTSDASAGVRSGSRTRASASATVVSGASTTGSEVIRPPAVSGEWLEQPPHRLGVLGVHPAQQQLGVGGRQLAEQVGGVVGIHRLEHVGGALGVELRAAASACSSLGQLLQDVGEPLVVERVDHLVAALGGQLADRVGDLDRSLALELFEQLRHALAGHRQRRRRQALHVLPVDDVRRCCDGRACGGVRTATLVTIQSRVRICSMPRSTTTTSTPASLRQLGVVDPDPGVEHLAEHQHLTGPLREPAQRHIGRGQRDRAGFDRGDPQDRHENPSAGEQFDDEAEHPRLLADDADADHHVADAADGLAVGAEHHHPREPGRVDPVDRHHDSKGRECGRG